jgi:hypothetical protein
VRVVDPLGPEGIWGLGRCERCGESFRANDERAETAAGIIHASCRMAGEELA